MQHQQQQISSKMPSFKLHSLQISTSRSFWQNFEKLRQFRPTYQAATFLFVVLLTFCVNINGPIVETTVAMATIEPNSKHKTPISNFTDYKENFIATGRFKIRHKSSADRGTKEDNKSKIRSSRKSYPGMINGNAFFRRPTATKETEAKAKAKAKAKGEVEIEIDEEEKTFDIEQIAGRPSQGGVIDFGYNVRQYAVQRQWNLEKGAATNTVAQSNNLALRQIGLEQQSRNNKNNNQDDNDHNKNKQAFLTRRKRFQGDSDRLQISDISDENSESSDLASAASEFVAESDSSNDSSNNDGINSNEKRKVATQNQTSTSTTTTTTTSISTLTLASTAKPPSFEIEDTSKLECRVERDLYLDFETYKHYSCANCYKKKDRIRLTDLSKKRKLLPNETETIRSTFRAENAFKSWQECCVKALECCLENQKYLPKTYNQFGELIDDDDGNGAGRDKCHATWDGLGCWPDSPAGVTAYRDCPDHAYFLEFVPICRGQVSKRCFSNGSWFVRNDHEWSDYGDCSGKSIYGTRLLIASVWHLVSVIAIGPALKILAKVPNRGGSKRVRILKNLLFWLLLNGLLASTYKMGIIAGYFKRTEANEDLPMPPPPAGLPSMDYNNNNSNYNNNNNNRTMITSSGPPVTSLSLVSHRIASYDDDDDDNHYHQNSAAKTRLERNTRHISSSSHSARNNKVEYEANLLELQVEDENVEFFDLWRQRLRKPRYRFKSNQRFGEDICDSNEEYYENNEYNGHYSAPFDNKDKQKNSKEFDHNFKGVAIDNYHATKDSLFIDSKNSQLKLQQNKRRLRIGNRSNNDVVLLSLNNSQEKFSRPSTTNSRSNTGPRCKRDTKHKKIPGQSNAFFSCLVLICWIFTVGIRITRLEGYSWMFTGAIYLCSLLHFAPAEPPALYIKWLLCLTNVFPVVIGLTYITVRTIFEPSPLNILVKGPYYYFVGDTKYVDYLWASQLTCWTGQSKYDWIEEIADFPNYVLVILNGVLFIVTLIIMCRITRPGSTRPDMSPGDYFRAAGTLVLLYGAHYALLAYRPPEENCLIGQVMHYSFLFVDGIQGMAVSYVFCYRTEGKEVINKWFKSFRESNLLHWCGFTRKKHVQIITSSKHGLLRASNKSNQSTRSTNSACNGNDPATELINISNSNSRAASQF